MLRFYLLFYFFSRELQKSKNQEIGLLQKLEKGSILLYLHVYSNAYILDIDRNFLFKSTLETRKHYYHIENDTHIPVFENNDLPFIKRRIDILYDQIIDAIKCLYE